MVHIFLNVNLERDATAFYEQSEVKKMKYESHISKMRKENKQKRIELAKTRKVSVLDFFICMPTI